MHHKKKAYVEHNKSECVFINTPTLWQSSPKSPYIVNLYIALFFPCFVNHRQKLKNTNLDKLQTLCDDK